MTPQTQSLPAMARFRPARRVVAVLARLRWLLAGTALGIMLITTAAGQSITDAGAPGVKNTCPSPTTNSLRATHVELAQRPHTTPTSVIAPKASTLRRRTQAVAPYNDPPTTPNLTITGITARLSTFDSHELSDTNVGFWEIGRLSDTWIQATITNTGATAHNALDAKLFRSTSSDVAMASDADRTPVATEPLTSRLEARTSVEVFFLNIKLPDTAGQYYYAIRIENAGSSTGTPSQGGGGMPGTNTEDIDIWNAATDNVHITVQQPADVAVTDITVNGNDSPIQVGSLAASLTFSITITNRGLGTSVPLPGSVQSLFHRNVSTDTLSLVTATFGTIPSLARNATHTQTATVTAPSELGEHEYYYRVDADPLVPTGCGNNTSSTVRVTVAYPTADLTVTRVDINNRITNQGNVLPGSTLNFAVAVDNLAPTTSVVPDNMWVEVSEIDQSGQPVVITRETLSPSVSGGQTRTVPLTATAKSTLTSYDLQFCAGTDATDTDPANNCHTVTISVTLPDFTVSDIIINNTIANHVNVLPDSTLSFSVSVGSLAPTLLTAPVSMWVEMSELDQNQQPTPLSREVITPGLNGDQTRTLMFTATAKTTLETYDLQFCAGSDSTDATPANDCRTVTISVVSRLSPAADIRLDDVLLNNLGVKEVPVLDVRAGANMQFTFTVTNDALTNAPSPRQVTAEVGVSTTGNTFQPLASTTIAISPAGNLSGRRSLTASISFVAPTVTGAHKLQLCITPDIAEASNLQRNNCRQVDINVKTVTGTITLRASPDAVRENSTSRTVALTAALVSTDPLPSAPIAIVLFASSGTAQAGAGMDFTVDFGAAPSSTLTIPANSRQGNVNITIRPVDDRVAEPSETFSIGGSAELYEVLPATITINDNDPPTASLNLTVNPDELSEDHSTGPTPVTVTVAVPIGASTPAETVDVFVSATFRHASAPKRIADIDAFIITLDAEAESATHTLMFTIANDEDTNENTVIDFAAASANHTLADATLTIYNDDPQPPANFTATPHLRRIVFNWTPPPANLGWRPFFYHIQRSFDADWGTGVETFTILNLNADVSTFTHEKLPDEYTAMYRIQTVLAYPVAGSQRRTKESTYSDAIEVTAIAPTPPSPPRNLRAIGSRKRVVLTWEPPADDGGDEVTDFRVSSAPFGTEFSIITTIRASESTTYTHRDLGDSETRRYVVLAINKHGASGPSDIPFATTDSAPATELIADLNFDGRVSKDDALLLYYAYALPQLVGDGTSSSGQESFRRAFIEPLIGDVLSVIDEDLRNTVLEANRLTDESTYPAMDINRSGTIDGNDAAITFFTVSFPELLGDGRNRHGFATYRAVFLANRHHPAGSDPSDDDLKELVLRVHELLATTTGP